MYDINNMVAGREKISRKATARYIYMMGAKDYIIEVMEEEKEIRKQKDAMHISSYPSKFTKGIRRLAKEQNLNVDKIT